MASKRKASDSTIQTTILKHIEIISDNQKQIATANEKYELLVTELLFVKKEFHSFKESTLNLLSVLTKTVSSIDSTTEKTFSNSTVLLSLFEQPPSENKPDLQ